MSEDQSDILKTSLFDNLRKLINIVDELRDVGLQQYIKLPRIAVVGSQSAGKSSLLESIVGLDFLPRGSGVVTRRPLEMRLVHVPESNGKINPYALFEDFKGQKFTDFDVVRQKIEELTDKVAGKNKGIVNDPITLTIYSNDCPDLTLIDLPGITRIPLKGSDQEGKDIEAKTKEMTLHYIKDERTIILCVIPANADISTSDALKLSMDQDKDGKRSIGVITKIDIMDKGTDARRMLMGLDIPLKLGYVGVRMRCQMDIDKKVRVQKALEEEKEFFAKHPVYSSMDPKFLGTKALIQKLTTVLYNHIKAYLPQIYLEIKEKIKDCEERLRDLGPPLPRDNKEKLQLIWNMITDFTENFKNSIRGKYDSRRTTNLNQELSGGAIIKMMFNELYEEHAHSKFKATKEYNDKDIERAIILHQGDSLPGFPSIDAFLYLINPQLEKLREPAQECLSQVYNYLENLANKIIKKIFVRFPTVMDEICELSSKVLQEQRDKAKEIVDNIIESEQGYLFTNDLEYLQQKSNLIPQSQGANNNQNVDPKKVFIDELRSRVDHYYQIVIRNVRDSIPKSLGFFLVKASQEQMQYSLYNEMMKREELMDSLGDPQHVVEERDTIQKTLITLRKAQKVLKRDPDLAIQNKFSDNAEDSVPAIQPQPQQQQQQQNPPQKQGDNSLFGNVMKK